MSPGGPWLPPDGLQHYAELRARVPNGRHAHCPWTMAPLWGAISNSKSISFHFRSHQTMQIAINLSPLAEAGLSHDLSYHQ